MSLQEARDGAWNATLTWRVEAALRSFFFRHCRNRMGGGVNDADSVNLNINGRAYQATWLGDGTSNVVFSLHPGNSVGEEARSVLRVTTLAGQPLDELERELQLQQLFSDEGIHPLLQGSTMISFVRPPHSTERAWAMTMMAKGVPLQTWLEKERRDISAEEVRRTFQSVVQTVCNLQPRHQAG